VVNILDSEKSLFSNLNQLSHEIIVNYLSNMLCHELSIKRARIAAALPPDT
jgi:hypothetical protein